MLHEGLATKREVFIRIANVTLRHKRTFLIVYHTLFNYTSTLQVQEIGTEKLVYQTELGVP